ncbi:MAG: glycosyl hydrolase [Myxococcota bacterium]
MQRVAVFAGALGQVCCWLVLGCGASGPDGLVEPPARGGQLVGSGMNGGGELIEAMVDRISTETNPNYRYSFEGAKFVPPEGKTLLILGQTLGGIEEHVASFPDQPLPGGWAAYWGIPSLDGVTNTFLNETGGRQNHQQLIDDYPNTVIQSGLWMVGNFEVARRTVAGEFDQVVRDFSRWVKNIERPFYLRIGYEFDGQHNALEPEEYVQAYRRIVDLMRSEGVRNVAFVWHSYAAPTFRGYQLGLWYPGDDYVDWVGISLFGQSYLRTPSREVETVFEYARDRRKPVMVAESSPVNGVRGPADWDRWFVNFFSLVYERNIKAVSFINEDWERFNFPGVSWGDSRLQNDPDIAAAWFLETNKDRYLKQSPELFLQLGYTP